MNLALLHPCPVCIGACVVCYVIYKLKKKKKMKLGDLVYYFTKYTGIRWIVKKIAGENDCGCDRRREEWNDIEIKFDDKWKKWIK